MILTKSSAPLITLSCKIRTSIHNLKQLHNLADITRLSFSILNATNKETNKNISQTIKIKYPINSIALQIKTYLNMSIIIKFLKNSTINLCMSVMVLSLDNLIRIILTSYDLTSLSHHLSRRFIISHYITIGLTI